MIRGRLLCPRCAREDRAGPIVAGVAVRYGICEGCGGGHCACSSAGRCAHCPRQNSPSRVDRLDLYVSALPSDAVGR